MKTKILSSILALVAGSLVAADPAAKMDSMPKTESAAKGDVVAAVKALAGKDNYSWTTTVTVPEGGRFRPGPTDGQTEKGGFTHVSLSFGGNTTEIVLKGDKATVKSPDSDWQSLAELEGDQGPARFMAAVAQNFKAPVAQATDLADGAKEIKKDGDAYSSDLTEDGAKGMLTFGRRGNAATVSDAKGTVKFWVKDGTLSKYETHVTGKVSFNGNDRDVERTSTTEIKNVGTTKVEVADGAKKKLNPESAPAPK